VPEGCSELRVIDCEAHDVYANIHAALGELPDRCWALLIVARMGFGYADVVGGYQSMPLKFESEGVVILVKGGTRMFPRRVRAAMEAEWPLFPAIRYDPSASLREKTQAFERAVRRTPGVVGGQWLSRLNGFDLRSIPFDVLPVQDRNCFGDTSFDSKC
jgi:hypothetical protein